MESPVLPGRLFTILHFLLTRRPFVFARARRFFGARAGGVVEGAGFAAGAGAGAGECAGGEKAEFGFHDKIFDRSSSLVMIPSLYASIRGPRLGLPPTGGVLQGCLGPLGGVWNSIANFKLHQQPVTGPEIQIVKSYPRGVTS